MGHQGQNMFLNTRTFLVSRTRTNFGDRAFSATGPRVCNYLLTDLGQPDLSYSRFRVAEDDFIRAVGSVICLIWCRVVRSRDVRSRVFSRPKVPLSDQYLNMQV